MNESRVPRGRATAGRAENQGVAEGLERLRETLLQRLIQIEALAAEQSAEPGNPDSDRERALREKVATLEASQARLHAEFRRREQEWEENMAQVEEDRKLLTEAWERLEREQADVSGVSESAAQTPSKARPPGPVPAATVYNPGADSVTTAILREFEALRGDIRRSAKSSTGR